MQTKNPFFRSICLLCGGRLVGISHLKSVIEGLLFASGDQGVTVKQLAHILNIDKTTVKHILDKLKFDYENNDRGITIIESHDIFYLATKPEHHHYIKQMIDTPHATKLSQAALETLAIIAYLQPITRTEIEEIRGIKSDRPVQTLLSRSLIEERGRKETVGKPILFGTSKDFLTYFGLTSLEELPPLSENIEETDVREEADLFFANFQKLNNNN